MVEGDLEGAYRTREKVAEPWREAEAAGTGWYPRQNRERRGTGDRLRPNCLLLSGSVRFSFGAFFLFRKHYTLNYLVIKYFIMYGCLQFFRMHQSLEVRHVISKLCGVTSFSISG